jgi:hypothetical protein
MWVLADMFDAATTAAFGLIASSMNLFDQGEERRTRGAWNKRGVVMTRWEVVSVVAGCASSVCWFASVFVGFQRTVAVFGAYWGAPVTPQPLPPTGRTLGALLLNSAAALFAGFAVLAQAAATYFAHAGHFDP